MNTERKLELPHKSCAAFWCGTMVLLFLFFSPTAFAAILPTFTLNVTKTDESCTANGTLSFTTSGTDPAANVEYEIFQLPDTTSPIVVTTGNSYGGLTAATYLVIATQSLNGESNTQQVEITIDNVIDPFAYSLTGIDANCGSDGSIIVNVTTGIASLYEIISGPVTMPVQTSSTFPNLPAGIYQVRVFDDCGEGYVQTFTLLTNTAQINISGLMFPSAQLPSCNTISITNILTPSTGDNLTYPLEVEYTVYPPGGGTPITVSTTVTTGGTQSVEVGAVLPFYHNSLYDVDITVTDHCGNQFSHTDSILEFLYVNLISEIAECGTYYLAAYVGNYVPPYNITFTSAPSGFDPAAFNSSHPGPFSGEDVAYGDGDTPVPFGTYSISLTDSCGRTATSTVTIIPPDTEPTVSFTAYPGCQVDMSQVTITILPFIIATAEITTAPGTYPHPLPHNVTAFINDQSELILENMMTGNYTVHLTDTCGNDYVHDFFVPIDSDANVANSNWPDCEPGFGSVKINGLGTQITSVVMVDAPSAFTQPLPYNVSFNISSGVFTMDSLPPGTYTFSVDDSCGINHPGITIDVLGYEVTQNDFELIPHCGSFDLSLTNVSNGIFEYFWLQQFFPATNNWGHPQTGVVYNTGDIVSSLNSISVNNMATTYNLGFYGTFRVIKIRQSFANGSTGTSTKDCFELVREFDFDDGFEILGLEKLTCDGQSTDIRIITNGVPPLTYKIISKNGDTSFIVDNGNNDFFADLEVATYEFQVQHACGHIRNIVVDIGLLPSPVIVPAAQQIPDFVVCDDPANDGFAEFTLSGQNALILGTQNPANYLLTYHLSEQDAESATNPLPDNYTSGNTVIYARLERIGTQCHEVTSFNIVVNPFPVLDMSMIWELCPNQNVTIVADAGMDSYLWSTGQTTPSITVSQPGDYTLTITTGSCEATIVVTVIPAEPPVIHDIEVEDWTSNENSITVHLSSLPGNYMYSLDNTNFQTSNVFSNLLPGDYTVYIKNSCGQTSEDVYILMYPKFFTPNGDGFNEFWRVKLSEREPAFKTIIFDRYGKLITSFMPDSPGWDGFYNGEKLPSTDYWFKITRQDGREHLGHFSMKR